MSKTAQSLIEMYRAAYERFGHQKWWPGQTKLEICVGAILTQNTSWTNVEKAIANLRSAGAMSVPALHALAQEQLAELIRPAGYFNIKARRLKNLIAAVHNEYGDDLDAFLDRPVPTLRETLLSINGIGRETADAIILYAAGMPNFVVDAYSFRIMLRHRLIDEQADYEAVKELLESNLPSDVELYNDFHAQFVAIGKHYCKPTARCEGCPLEHLPHDRLAGTSQAD